MHASKLLCCEEMYVAFLLTVLQCAVLLAGLNSYQMKTCGDL